MISLEKNLISERRDTGCFVVNLNHPSSSILSSISKILCN